MLGFVSWYVYAGQEGVAVLYIQNSSDSWIYPLEKEVELDIPGPLGVTHVHIKEGAAFVENSPCRDKICIHMGRISRNGEWIACLPNRVFLRIQGKKGEVVDAGVF